MVLATTPGVFGSGLLIAYPVMGVVLAVCLFVVPVWDAHLVLQRAKRSMLRDIGVELERAVREMTRACRTDEDASSRSVTRSRESFEALRAAHTFVKGIPTWPWSPDAPRVLGSAILLPVVVYVIQRLLERSVL